jgi:hypothetical protein
MAQQSAGQQQQVVRNHAQPPIGASFVYGQVQGPGGAMVVYPQQAPGQAPSYRYGIPPATGFVYPQHQLQYQQMFMHQQQQLMAGANFVSYAQQVNICLILLFLKSESCNHIILE